MKRTRKIFIIGGIYIRLVGVFVCLLRSSTTSKVDWRGSTEISDSGEDREGLFIKHDVSETAAQGGG